MVELELTDYVFPLGGAPEEVRQAVKSWEQWIDYWAVDWDHQGDIFNNQWQGYRTRTKRSLRLTVTHAYEQPGSYTIAVRAIDILGNETSGALTIEVSEQRGR